MSEERFHSMPLSRRRLLAVTGAGVLAATAVSALPRAARATQQAAEELLGELVGGAKIQEGKVELRVPEIAENGNTVPFVISVDSPMSDDNYVKAIHVVAEGNPSPDVASFYLGPDVGKAEVAMRMRLAKTQYVRAVAVMNDGSVWGARKEIKVTIGGCGG